jgi:hypothetical protein
LSFLVCASVVASIAGCEGGSSDPVDAGAACPEGQVLREEACDAVLPDAACPAGKRAALGSTTCVDVGWSACPQGFAPHASGWGCRALIPDTACEGATRDVLGETGCRPVGDCGAPFPPPDATRFVNAQFADSQLDAAHFRTIASALSGAPAGAVVAIDAGRYAENLTLRTRVTLVGRCAEKAVIAGGRSAEPGIVDYVAVTVRGLTVSGYAKAVYVERGGDLRLESSILTDNLSASLSVFDGAHATLVGSVVRRTTELTPGAQTTAIFAGAGARVDLTDSVVSGNADGALGAADAGTVIAMERSIVRGTVARSDRVGGVGAKAFDGAAFDFKSSAVVGNRGMGILLQGKDTHADLEHVVLSDTLLDDRNAGGLAWGISVLRGASLTMVESALVDNPVVGLSVVDAGSHAEVTRSNVTSMRGAGFSGIGTAVYAQRGASLTLTSTAIFQALGVAVVADNANTSLSLDDSVVASTLALVPDKGGTSGGGGTAVGVLRGARATVTRSTLVDSREVAAACYDPGSTLVLDRALVDGISTNDNHVFGHGVVGNKGAHVTIAGSVIQRSAGIGVAFASSTGLVTGSFVRDNAIGIHVQDGSVLNEVEAAPEAAGDLEVVVTKDTRFTGNATKVGSGEIPLPSPIKLPAQ